MEQAGITGRHDGLLLAHPGEQIFLPGGVQLAEHIVQQHHRVLPGNLLGTAGLRQLQAQHSASLLALAGKQLGGLAVQQHREILPVRPRRGKARLQVRPSAFPQGFQQALIAEAGLIHQLQALACLGNIPVVGDSQRPQPLHVVHSAQRELLPVAGQLLVEHIQHLGRSRSALIVLEQRVFLGQQPGIPPPGRQIPGIQLAQRRVQKAPPPLRAALHQAQIARLEHHRREAACQRGCPAQVYSVALGCPARTGSIPAAHRQINLVLLPVAGLGFGLQHRKGLVPGDQLRVLCAPEAFASGKQPHRLQQIGFALAVFAADDRQLRAGGKIRLPDVPVILQ